MRQYKYLMPACIVTRHPSGIRQAKLNLDFKMDTGYDGYAFISEDHIPNITPSGVRLYPLGPEATMTFGNGRVVRGQGLACRAHLVKIGDYEFPPPGLDLTLLVYGHGEPVIGLRLLSRWIAEFNGPRQLLKLFVKQ